MNQKMYEIKRVYRSGRSIETTLNIITREMYETGTSRETVRWFKHFADFDDNASSNAYFRGNHYHSEFISNCGSSIDDSWYYDDLTSARTKLTKMISREEKKSAGNRETYAIKNYNFSETKRLENGELVTVYKYSPDDEYQDANGAMYDITRKTWIG